MEAQQLQSCLIHSHIPLLLQVIDASNDSFAAGSDISEYSSVFFTFQNTASHLNSHSYIYIYMLAVYCKPAFIYIYIYIYIYMNASLGDLLCSFHITFAVHNINSQRPTAA
jgi:hypothetical protein